MTILLDGARIYADALIGQCLLNLEDFATEVELNDAKFLEAFDDLAFCCDLCNWWCSADEMNDIGVTRTCDDCSQAVMEFEHDAS